MKPADGMWEFPTFSELPAGAFKKVGECRHTITHHRLDVSVYKGTIEAITSGRMRARFRFLPSPAK